MLIEHVTNSICTGPSHPTGGIGFVNEVAKLPDGSIDMVRGDRPVFTGRPAPASSVSY